MPYHTAALKLLQDMACSLARESSPLHTLLNVLRGAPARSAVHCTLKCEQTRLRPQR